VIESLHCFAALWPEPIQPPFFRHFFGHCWWYSSAGQTLWWAATSVTDPWTLLLLDNLQEQVPRAKSAYIFSKSGAACLCPLCYHLSCWQALPDIFCSVDQIKALQARRGTTAQCPTCSCSCVRYSCDRCALCADIIASSTGCGGVVHGVP